MMPVLITSALALIVSAVAPTEASAESAWVSDEFRVPMRSGPSRQHRVIHRGIPSGTELVILEVDAEAGFTLARTINGTEGWLPNQYVANEPVAKIRIVETELDLRIANAEIESLRTQLATVPRLDTSEIARERDELLRLNARLRDEVGDLIETNRQLEQSNTRNALLIGAVLLLGGLGVGVLVKSRNRQSGW